MIHSRINPRQADNSGKYCHSRITMNKNRTEFWERGTKYFDALMAVNNNLFRGSLGEKIFFCIFLSVEGHLSLKQSKPAI